ncbi:hypothetical protein PHISP_08875, partial [Aspergillus sp. HF37]
VDRRQQADGHRHQQRDEADVQRPPQQRQHAKTRIAFEARRPDGAEEEVGQAVLAEEADRLEDQ